MGDELRVATPHNVTPIDVLPTQIKKVRSETKTRAAKLLARIFENTDDALFDLADRTGNDGGHTSYLLSMRELRIQRKSIENSFIESLEGAFSSLVQPQQRLSSVSSEGGLSLVHEDEMEENIAVSTMVAKITSNYGVVLSQITRRLDSLINKRKVTEVNNPVGGEVICESFKKACRSLDVDLHTKLIIYKIFDKVFVAELEDFYFEINQKLFELGVLPDLKANTIERSKAFRTSDRSIHNAPRASDEEVVARAEQAFGALQSLLTQSRFTRSGSADLLPVEEDGPVLTRNDLVDLFSDIQHSTASSSKTLDLQPGKLDIYSSLHNLLSSSATSQPKALGRADDDTINLISMLFEFILDDRQLSSPMKAILGRLQIPMLKVAILDKTFFSRAGHPARKLLNELASSALGWTESQGNENDPVYKQIKKVVDTILNDFVDDLDIFERLQSEFSSFIAREKRRAQLIEQRTRDAEEGRAVSTNSRKYVSSVLNEVAAGKNLPGVVVNLLKDGWSKYMFLVHVREGPDSKKWKEAVETADDLVWSVQEKSDSSERNQLLVQIPDILRRLRMGLDTVSYGKAKIREQFVSLEGFHLQCLRNEPIESIGSDVSEPESGDEQHNARLDNSNAPASAEQEASTQPEEATGQEPQIEDAAIVKSAVLFQSALDETNVKQNEPGKELSTALKSIESISPGTWVEFRRNDEKLMRAKLAAVIKASGNYIFVNRLGIKIAEETPVSLARLVEDDMLSILNSAQVFDKALESVIENLRASKS